MQPSNVCVASCNFSVLWTLFLYFPWATNRSSINWHTKDLVIFILEQSDGQQKVSDNMGLIFTSVLILTSHKQQQADHNWHKTLYKRFMKFSSWGNCDARTISDQDLSVSQLGAGFGWGLCSATPPVNRKRQTLSSTSSLYDISSHSLWHTLISCQQL